MRISEAFKEAPLLIVYICAGDPRPEATPDLVSRLAEAGADMPCTCLRRKRSEISGPGSTA